MDASPKRASTPVDDSVLNNTAFSMDSLQVGDSTRSLLSPLYDIKGQELDKELTLHEKIDSEKYDSCSHSTRRSTGGRSSRSDESDTYSSDYEESETTVKKEKVKKTSVSESSSSFSSISKTKTSKTKLSDSVNSLETDTEEQPCLSPWEKWLLAKVVEDKNHAKIIKRNKKVQKEVEYKEMNEKSEKERQAEVNRKEWLRLKQSEKIKNERAARMEYANLCKKREEEQARIEEKAEESYDKWLELKENELKGQNKSRRLSEKEKKENELERKQKSEEAYKLWVEKSKLYQKSKNNHFGYLGGKITGYYDWTTYPMPSYSNPKPWVSPKARTPYQSKIKLQNPSPPLLFKELEERERNAKQKQNNTMKQSRNSIC